MLILLVTLDVFKYYLITYRLLFTLFDILSLHCTALRLYMDSYYTLGYGSVSILSRDRDRDSS